MKYLNKQLYMKVLFDFQLNNNEESTIKMDIKEWSGNKNEYDTFFKTLNEFIKQLPELYKQPIMLINK